MDVDGTVVAFQLAAELYTSEGGAKFTHVNYKGTGPVITALLGNEVDLGFLDIAAVLPQIQAGRLKAVAVTTAKRSSVLPQVPKAVVAAKLAVT